MIKKILFSIVFLLPGMVHGAGLCWDFKDEETLTLALKTNLAELQKKTGHLDFSKVLTRHMASERLDFLNKLTTANERDLGTNARSTADIIAQKLPTYYRCLDIICEVYPAMYSRGETFTSGQNSFKYCSAEASTNFDLLLMQTDRVHTLNFHNKTFGFLEQNLLARQQNYAIHFTPFLETATDYFEFLNAKVTELKQEVLRAS